MTIEIIIIFRRTQELLENERNQEFLDISNISPAIKKRLDISFIEGLMEKTLLNGSNVDPNFDISFLNNTSKNSYLPQKDDVESAPIPGKTLDSKNNNGSAIKLSLTELSQNQTVTKGLKISGFFNAANEPETTKNKGNTPISHLQLKSSIQNKLNPLKMTKTLKTSSTSSLHPTFSPQT